MPDNRIRSHPILPAASEPTVPFYWNDQRLNAKPGEMISSALMANGITIFRHHPKDASPQGIFCANGQCAQCMVIADGLPVKSCMTAVKADMRVQFLDGLPELPEVNVSSLIESSPTPTLKTDVLIIGAGPAGLSAATELGKLGARVLLVDDKDRLGGKLVLQTHRFFGSSEAVYAGTRGVDIAKKLSHEVAQQKSVEIWLNSTAVAIYDDKTVGVFRDQQEYWLVQPEILLVATGAREKSLSFSGNTLPGIYGAGAFQTLVNRDLVRPCKNLFIIGGGNVGLIAGYHAIQAGIKVAGLAEAAPKCGGYKVHEDKLARSGVPIYTSHTILRAEGQDSVERVIICKVDDRFHPIPGTERSVACDTVLIAVGLDPVNEFLLKAREVGLPVYAAGDANEIAEASAAIFSGKITGNEIAVQLGLVSDAIPEEWKEFEEILKSKPGRVHESKLENVTEGVYPVMHCTQEIPCDPCSSVCPRNYIKINKADIRNVPEFVVDDGKHCIACARCVAVCPGLAITLVDFRKQNGQAIVTLPFEQEPGSLSVGQLIEVTDTDGGVLGSLPISSIKKAAGYEGTQLISVEAPVAYAVKIAGLRLIEPQPADAFDDPEFGETLDDDAYICRCERVTVKELRALIRSGVRDINQIKAETKASMGACGGKTCLTMIRRLFLAEGIPLAEVTDPPIRPVFVEVPIGILANLQDKNGGEQ